MKNKIFIQIPAYRDTELQPTLYDLIDKSAYKDRLRIVVAWQYDELREKLDFAFLEKHQVELIKIPASQSLGCNWARSLLQQKWNGEKYTVMLDSHHRFVTAWDEEVISMYELLKSKGIPKPIITAYLPMYDPFNDPGGRSQQLLRMCFHERKKGLLFRLNSRELPSADSMKEPVAAHFTSLHFLFTSGKFNEEIAFDPSIYFFADEIAIALCAYTKGYDLFHPHRILGWHLYNRTTRITHWADHPEWIKQNEVSYHRLFQLYRGYVTGKYGIGAKRGVENYENYIGMKLIDPAPNQSHRPRCC